MPMRLAILLPTPYWGGVLRGLKATARMLAEGAKDTSRELALTVGIPAGSYDIDRDFPDLLDLGIAVRPFVWRSAAAAAGTGKVVPDDGLLGFAENDFWLLFVDRLPAPPLAPCPYAVYAHDFIQRYVPRDFGAFWGKVWQSMAHIHIPLYRNAAFTAATTPGTLDDLVGYYGVPRARTRLLPQYHTPLPRESKPVARRFRDRPYFLWVTNNSIHKNHLAALRAFQIYFRQMNGGLACVVCGYDTAHFDPRRCQGKGRHRERLRPYEKEVRDMIAADPVLAAHLEFPGYIDEAQYVGLLQNCAFVFHDVLADNGTFSVIEAAEQGRASLASSYPQMRYMADAFKTQSVFFDPYDPEDTARQLKAMEESYPHRNKSLEFYAPPRDAMDIRREFASVILDGAQDAVHATTAQDSQAA